MSSLELSSARPFLRVSSKQPKMEPDPRAVIESVADEERSLDSRGEDTVDAPRSSIKEALQPSIPLPPPPGSAVNTGTLLSSSVGLKSRERKLGTNIESSLNLKTREGSPKIDEVASKIEAFISGRLNSEDSSSFLDLSSLNLKLACPEAVFLRPLLSRLCTFRVSELDVSLNRLNHNDVKLLSMSLGSCLTRLDLACNHIRDLPADVGKHLSALRVLSLSNNRLQSVRPLLKCVSMRRLDLSVNALETCEGLEAMPGLRYLNVAENNMKNPWIALRPLTCSHSLSHIEVRGNPFDCQPGGKDVLEDPPRPVRIQIMSLFPSLMRIDQFPVKLTKLCSRPTSSKQMGAQTKPGGRDKSLFVQPSSRGFSLHGSSSGPSHFRSLSSTQGIGLRGGIKAFSNRVEDTEARTGGETEPLPSVMSSSVSHVSPRSMKSQVSFSESVMADTISRGLKKQNTKLGPHETMKERSVRRVSNKIAAIQKALPVLVEELKTLQGGATLEVVGESQGQTFGGASPGRSWSLGPEKKSREGEARLDPTDWTSFDPKFPSRSPSQKSSPRNPAAEEPCKIKKAVSFTDMDTLRVEKGVDSGVEQEDHCQKKKIRGFPKVNKSGGFKNGQRSKSSRSLHFWGSKSSRTPSEVSPFRLNLGFEGTRNGGCLTWRSSRSESGKPAGRSPTKKEGDMQPPLLPADWNKGDHPKKPRKSNERNLGRGFPKPGSPPDLRAFVQLHAQDEECSALPMPSLFSPFNEARFHPPPRPSSHSPSTFPSPGGRLEEPRKASLVPVANVDTAHKSTKWESVQVISNSPGHLGTLRDTGEEDDFDTALSGTLARIRSLKLQLGGRSSRSSRDPHNVPEYSKLSSHAKEGPSLVLDVPEAPRGKARLGYVGGTEKG